MRNYEYTLLYGAFLCIFGAFLPWHTYRYDYTGWGIVGGDLSELMMLGGIPGFLTVAGLGVLIASLAVSCFIIFGVSPQPSPRMQAGMMFFSLLTVALFFVGGIAPVFFNAYVQPHAGLIIPLVGSIFMMWGIKSARD